MEPIRKLEDCLQYRIGFFQGIKLKRILKEMGFKIEGSGHILPSKIPKDYYFNDFGVLVGRVPAPVGFITGSLRGYDFFIQYINIDSLKIYTDKLKEICDRIN